MRLFFKNIGQLQCPTAILKLSIAHIEYFNGQYAFVSRIYVLLRAVRNEDISGHRSHQVLLTPQDRMSPFNLTQFHTLLLYIQYHILMSIDEFRVLSRWSTLCTFTLLFGRKQRSFVLLIFFSLVNKLNVKIIV